MRSFGSDNHSGVPSAVLEAIGQANSDHAAAYGADPWTARAEQCFRDQLGEEAQAFLVFNGSGANVLALRATCQPWEAVVCAESSHINLDECGAPERIAGVKLCTAATADGKLTPALIDPLLVGTGEEHHVQIRLVSITQSTERGTCYSPDELRALADHAHSHGLLVHVDGARICNAAASLGLPLRAITTDVGIDVLSFGGTKVGLLGAEAVVFLRPELAENFRYLRKQTLQLASKGRFLAAQFIALLEDDRWLALASHANAMAQRLAAGAGELEHVTITECVQANAVFATIPQAAIGPLQAEWSFHVWDGARSEVRWMCSWDTTPEEVDAFVSAIGVAVGG
jgi:threonine aldolase